MTRHNPEFYDAPKVRARKELGKAIYTAEIHEVFTVHQARALREQLIVGSSDVWLNRTVKVKNRYLGSIQKVIADREVELQTRKFVGRQLGYFGLLGLVIGNPDEGIPPLSRVELLNAPQVESQAENNPSIDRNIILDKTVQREVEWLSAFTRPIR